MKKKPLVNKRYLLRKFPGKGGWTYAAIPEVLQNKDNPFGWVQVNGTIDGYPLKHYKLMPMGNGKLFLPVKAAIRKQIGKQAGDLVHVTLFADTSPLDIPDEIMQCFAQEPKQVYEKFMTFSESEKKAYLDWVFQSRTDEIKATRILSMMERVSKGLKFYDRKAG